jgi:replication-associated recombination protein RarA
METLFAMESQQSIGFPKPLTEEFRPLRICDFVGLEKQKKVLTNLVRKPRPCALLFVGNSGSGKTTLAQAFSCELNATLWEVGSQECSVDRLRELVFHCSFVPKAGLSGYHVILVNEADCMSDAAAKFLLSKLDSSGQLSNVIWIFTCNSTDKLEERFLSRCLNPGSFNSYGAGNDIVDLLSRVWKAKAPASAEVPNFRKLTCGNVRESLQRLEVELLSA